VTTPDDDGRLLFCQEVVDLDLRVDVNNVVKALEQPVSCTGSSPQESTSYAAPRGVVIGRDSAARS